MHTHTQCLYFFQLLSIVISPYGTTLIFSIYVIWVFKYYSQLSHLCQLFLLFQTAPPLSPQFMITLFFISQFPEFLCLVFSLNCPRFSIFCQYSPTDVINNQFLYIVESSILEPPSLGSTVSWLLSGPVHTSYPRTSFPIVPEISQHWIPVSWVLYISFPQFTPLFWWRMSLYDIFKTFFVLHSASLIVWLILGYCDR